jgi:hypothetical protein
LSILFFRYSFLAAQRVCRTLDMSNENKFTRLTIR